MKLKYLILSVLVLVTTYSCTAQKKEKAISSLDRIDTIIQKAVKDKHVPSFAVGVVKGGEVVYAKALGYSDVERKEKADAQMLYQLGSVTKTMTGHVLAGLIENGTIALSDPLSNYFPDTLDFPTGTNGEVITVQHIATHSAGFPRYPENLDRVDPNPILGYTKEQLYRGIEMVTIETIPGQEYDYSNFGYGVLGTALENATGQSLGDLFKSYLFIPAEMSQSTLMMHDQIKTKLATPYLEVDPYQATKPWQMGSLAGAGNAFSNLEDMNKFLIHLLEKSAINKRQQSPLQVLGGNENRHYGLGCFVIDAKDLGTLRIHHGGDVDGYASTINLYPEYDLGMVIMTNNGDSGLLGPIFMEIRNTVTAYYIQSDVN